MFERIKRFYVRNLWTIGQVWDAVGFKTITEAQYTEITNEKYDADNRPSKA